MASVVAFFPIVDYYYTLDFEYRIETGAINSSVSTTLASFRQLDS